MAIATEVLSHKDKIKWMKAWCKKTGLRLSLKGECGFSRPCVGVLARDVYPDYIWYDKEYRNRVDPNGEVWTPENAYHKHPCVAVLGWGEESEAQLYEWLKWFDENNFSLVVVERPKAGLSEIDLLLSSHLDVRLQRQVFS